MLQPPRAPKEHNAERITYFGITDTRGKHLPFGIKQNDRSKHTYVIGKSGMGKSTLLENMAVQDIQNGEGICFIDPHGSTAERLMEYIPADRVKDVLYFAPFDLQYPISFNVLENVDADKRHLVVAGLMSAFEKIWVDAWSARMAYILQNTIAALLEFPGATLLGVNRMYIDKDYRKNVIAHITDPSVRSFWVDEFAKYTDRYAQEATPAIQNKIGQFASNALVRNVIGQETSSFNIRDIMDQRKIFIVNLSKGRVGEGNANLLGSMLITKIYLAAMSRADVSLSEQKSLPPFFLFVDEFQNFANKSFAEILSEARKYKLALTIAHQYIEQMEEEVRAAVFGNVGTMIVFRVGAYDAEVLEKEFAPTFEIDDIVNLGARQIYLKLMIDNVSSQPFSATTMPPIPEPESSQTDRAIAYSRARFSRPRAEVEKAIKDWNEKRFEDPEPPARERGFQEGASPREGGNMRGFRESVSPTQARRFDTRSPIPQQSPRNSAVPFAPQRDTRPPRPPTQAQQGMPRATQQGEQRQGVRPPLRQGAPRPVSKQESRDSLRNILATLAKPEPAVQKESAQHAPQRPLPPKPPRVEDGKSVTDEGKAQLRSLLSALTKEDAPSRSAPVAQSSTPLQTTAPNMAGIQKRTPEETSIPKSDPAPPQPVVLAPRHIAPEKAQPVALSPEALRAMLETKKPKF